MVNTYFFWYPLLWLFIPLAVLAWYTNSLAKARSEELRKDRGL